MLDMCLIFQVIIWGVVGILFFSSRQATIYHPLFFYWIFHGIVFVIYPLADVYIGFYRIWNYLGFSPTENEYIKALLVSSIGFLAFAIASSLAARKVRPAFILSDRQPLTKVQRIALGITWLLLGPLAIYSIVFTIGGADLIGNGAVQMEVVNGVSINMNTTGYLTDARNMMISLLILTVLLTRWKWWSLFVVSLFIGYRMYVGWGRWTIIVTALMLLLLYLWEKRMRWPNRKAILIGTIVAPVILITFAALGENRELIKSYITGETVTKTIFDDRSFSEKMDSPDFANFSFLAYITAIVPEKSGTYTYGTQYLALFTEPVPRILWKNKPVGPPIQLVNLNDYGNFAFMTTSLVGDAWMTGGWLGVVGIMALAGFGLGRVYRWFWKNSHNTAKALIYIVMACGLIQLYRDGGPVSIAKYFLFLSAPIFVWLSLCHMLVRITGSHRHRLRGGPSVSSSAYLPR